MYRRTDALQGFVTATQKLNRRAIQERYAKDIQECYAAAG